MSFVTIGVGVGTAAIGAGVSMHNANKQAKATEEAAQSGALGGRPNIPDFEPIDMDEEQRKAIMGNLEALPDIQSLVNGTNKMVTQDAMRRAKKLIPGYRQSMKAYGTATGNLLNGRLPYDDVMGIVSNRAELAGSVGVPGLAGNATLKDLGISRLDALKTGGGMMQDMVRIAETVSPRSTYLNPATQFVSPMERIRLAQQNQENMYAVSQNQAITAASPDPAQLAMMQAQANQPDWVTLAGDAAKAGLGAYGAKQAQAGSWGGNTSPAGRPGTAYFDGRRVPVATAV